MRKGVHVVMKEDVWKEFLLFVKNKYGKIKGVVGIELEIALKNHMTAECMPREAPPSPAPEQEQRTAQATLAPLSPESSILYTNTRNHKTKQKLQQLNQLIAAIRALGQGARVSQKLLEKKMVETLGILTPPTRQAYIQNKILFGVIEPDGDGFYHIL